MSTPPSSIIHICLFVGLWSVSAGAAPNALQVFDEFSRIFDDHYAFFALRGVDWEQQKKTFRPKVHASLSDDDLYAILCQMIDPLDDGHTSVYRGTSRCRSADYPPWRPKMAEIEAFIVAKYLKGSARHAGAISYGPINDETAYINIHHMGGCTLLGLPWQTAPELDEALATMTKATKIIVDVRFNGGGYDACALGFASRFTDQKRLVATKETYYKGRWRDRRDIHISPKGRVNTTARLIVLTSRGTVSAGEVFVMAVSTLPQATIIGERTEGMHSDIYERKLSNGWKVGLSNESYTLPDGKIYEKIGRSPQISIPFSGDVIEQGTDEILERALTL